MFQDSEPLEISFVSHLDLRPTVQRPLAFESGTLVYTCVCVYMCAITRSHTYIYTGAHLHTICRRSWQRRAGGVAIVAACGCALQIFEAKVPLCVAALKR